jgi:hypothetical protein
MPQSKLEGQKKAQQIESGHKRFLFSFGGQPDLDWRWDIAFFPFRNETTRNIMAEETRTERDSDERTLGLYRWKRDNSDDL